MHSVFLVDHAAPSGAVNTLASVHTISFKVFGKPSPDGIAGHAFLCIHMCAFVSRSSEEVGDGSASRSIQGNCRPQPGVEA